MTRRIANIDVNGALGYLAYDGDTNPNGFLTRAALDGYATTSQLNARIANLVGSAPGTLDTLAELAAQMQADESGAVSLAALVATKQDAGQVAAIVADAAARTISGVLDVAHGGTGAASAEQARANLGLTDAAARPVGAGAGTVAAGDDPRIVGAQSAGQVDQIVTQRLAGYSSSGTVSAQIAAGVAEGVAANVSGVVALSHGGTGAVTAADARAALGLGQAATLPVGSTANTVAAGNDPRILAAQTASQVGAAIAAQLTGYATASTVQAQVAALVGSAPAALDTLGELAAQLQADEGAAATLTAMVAAKQDALGFAPVQQGTGAGQTGNMVKIGWSAEAKLKATVDAVGLGNFAFEAWVDANYATRLNGAFANAVRIDDPRPSSTSQLIVSAPNSDQGANLRLFGNGAATPSKSIRAQAGRLEFVNDAYNSVIAALSDAGDFSARSLAAGRQRAGVAGVSGALTGAESWGLAQGGWQGWNLDIGGGRTDFVNSRGGGAGGFDFWNVATDAAASPTRLLRIDAAGGLTSLEGRLATRAWADARYLTAVSVRGFGAVGNGVIDDTLAFQTAINDAAARGAAVHVPGGVYRLSAQLAIGNGAFSLIGEGMGVSVLVWDAGGARGIRVSQDSDRHPASIAGVSLRTKGQGGAAVFIDTTPQITPNNGDPVVVNRYSPRFSLRDVEICSDTDPFNQFWEGGCDLLSTVIAVFHNLNFEGGYGSPGVYKALYGIRVAGGGHPTQVTVNASSFYGVQNGIVASGVEGLHVGTTNIVGVTNGITFDDSANPDSARPLCVVTGTHVNACGAAVIGNNVNDVILTGNDFYFCIDAQADGIGVLILGRESSNCVIQGNSFVNTSQTYGYTGVVLTKAAGSIVAGNVFHRTRFNANAPSSGILIRADSVNARVAGNHFNVDPGVGPFVFEVLDQGQNSILPAMGATVSRKRSRQAVAAYQAANIEFDGPEQFTANNAWWTADDPAKLTIHVPGLYQFSAVVGWDDTPTGFRLAEIRRGGDRISGLPSQTTLAASGLSASQTLTSAPVRCAAGDSFVVLVISSVDAQIDNDGRTSFSITRLGD